MFVYLYLFIYINFFLQHVEYLLVYRITFGNMYVPMVPKDQIQVTRDKSTRNKVLEKEKQRNRSGEKREKESRRNTDKALLCTCSAFYYFFNLLKNAFFFFAATSSECTLRTKEMYYVLRQACSTANSMLYGSLQRDLHDLHSYL